MVSRKTRGNSGSVWARARAGSRGVVETNARIKASRARRAGVPVPEKHGGLRSDINPDRILPEEPTSHKNRSEAHACAYQKLDLVKSRGWRGAFWNTSAVRLNRPALVLFPIAIGPRRFRDRSAVSASGGGLGGGVGSLGQAARTGDEARRSAGSPRHPSLGAAIAQTNRNGRRTAARCTSFHNGPGSVPELGRRVARSVVRRQWNRRSPPGYCRRAVTVLPRRPRGLAESAAARRDRYWMEEHRVVPVQLRGRRPRLTDDQRHRPGSVGTVWAARY